MSSIPKRVFTSEYRAEAVKLVTEGKLGVSAAAGKLGVERLKNPDAMDWRVEVAS